MRGHMQHHQVQPHAFSCPPLILARSGPVMASAEGAAAAGDEALTTAEPNVSSNITGVRRGPCNTWVNAESAGHATSGRRTRRGSVAGSDDEGPAARRTRLCSTAGCGRRYTKCRHAHCCSLCSMGHHTDRCDAKWAKFRVATLRLRISSCLVQNCQRAAGTGHIHCCGMCAPSAGAQHTEACTERQKLCAYRAMCWCNGEC